MKVAIIINPIAGTGGRPEVARVRAEHAASAIEQFECDGEVFVSERPGHARELAAAALTRGADVVVAWGGDGTVNEVASAVAFHDAALAIVPSGSGNGLARELGIPLQPETALNVVFTGRVRVIDAGELDGRLFFNIAGIGLDARVAHRFAANGLARRGFLRYLDLTARELFTYRAEEHSVVTDGEVLRTRTLLIAIANARQYGNGALIAPEARLDDGLLDVVVIEDRSPFAALVQVPAVFMGRIADVPGVTMRPATDIEIASAQPVIYHVDGEPFVGGAVIRARPRALALRVVVPSR